MTITITGNQELSRLLKQAERSLTDKEIKKILKDSAAGMIWTAKADALTMLNPNKRTYNLYRTRTHYTLKPGMVSRSIGVKAMRGNAPVVIIAPMYTRSYNTDPWFYHIIHEGTTNRSTFKGVPRGQLDKRRPFLDRAGSRTMRDYTAGLIIKKIKMRLTQLGL